MGTGGRTGTKRIWGAGMAARETEEMGRGERGESCLARALGDGRDMEQRSWTLQVHPGRGSGETVELSTEGGAERARPPETGEESGEQSRARSPARAPRVTPSMPVSPQSKARGPKAMLPLDTPAISLGDPTRRPGGQLAGPLGDDTCCHWPFPRVSPECGERVTVSVQDTKSETQNSQILTFATRPVTLTPARHRAQTRSLRAPRPPSR